MSDFTKFPTTIEGRKRSYDYAIKQAQDPIVQLKLQAFRKLSQKDKEEYELTEPTNFEYLNKMQLYSLEARFYEKFEYYSRSCGIDEIKNLRGPNDKMVHCLYRKYPTLQEIQTKGGIQIKQFLSMFFKCICWGYQEPFIWTEHKDLGTIDSKSLSNVESNSVTYIIKPGGVSTYPPYPPIKKLQGLVLDVNGQQTKMDTLPRITVEQITQMCEILYPGFIASGQAQTDYWDELMDLITDAPWMGNNLPPCSLSKAYNILHSVHSYILGLNKQILKQRYNDARRKWAASKIQKLSGKTINIQYWFMEGDTKKLLRQINNFKITDIQVYNFIKIFTNSQVFALMARPYIPYDEQREGLRYIIYEQQIRATLYENNPNEIIKWF